MQGFHGGRVKKQAVFQPRSSLPGSQWKYRREWLYTANASGLLGPPSLEESQSLSLSLLFVFAQYAQFFQVFSSQVLPTLSSYSFTVLFLFTFFFLTDRFVIYLLLQSRVLSFFLFLHCSTGLSFPMLAPWKHHCVLWSQNSRSCPVGLTEEGASTCNRESWQSQGKWNGPVFWRLSGGNGRCLDMIWKAKKTAALGIRHCWQEPRIY